MATRIPRENQVTGHTDIPARPDLVRLGLGIIGIGTSGPLIATSLMPVPTLIFWRNLGGAFLTLPFAIRHGQWRDRIGMTWSVIAGVLLAFHFFGLFLAMRLTSVAAGIALTALQPIFAAIFVKFSGGHIPRTAWLGMLVSFSGVLLVSGVDLQISFRSFVGDLAALFAGAIAVLYLMAGGRAQEHIETTSYTTVCYFICAITALPLSLIYPGSIFSYSAREWWIVIGLVIGAQILGHTMFNSALKRVSPTIISLLIFLKFR